MCLALPMKIIEITGAGKAIVDLDGARYEADLTLIEDPEVGQYVIVHTGYAIERLDPDDAEERLKLFAEMARFYREEGHKGG